MESSKHISVVDNVSVKTIALSSNFQIGDSSNINANALAFAVQREVEIFYGNEGRFQDYAIFSEVIPTPPISENVKINRYNANPTIYVSDIRIIGITASSIFHIGNTKEVNLESRIHHIRQLKERE